MLFYELIKIMLNSIEGSKHFQNKFKRNLELVTVIVYSFHSINGNI